MSTVVILIFATLVISTVDTSGSTDRLRSVQDRLSSYLATEIDKLKEKCDTTAPTFIKNDDKLFDGADIIFSSAYDNAKEDTLELSVKTLIMTGTEDCDKIVNSIYDEGRVFLSNVYTCTVDILNTSFFSVREMLWTYECLRDTLIDLKVKIGACARIFNMATEVESAILCTEKIESQAKSFISDSIPPMTAEINKADHSLTISSNLVETCMNGFADYKVCAADLTKKANECYYRLLSITSEPTEAAPTTLQATDEVGGDRVSPLSSGLS